MNDISKQYKITLNTKGTNTLSSDQLLFNHGDDVTIKISIVEDNVNKDISQSKVDLLVLYESDSDPTIHRFEDGGISINDNEVTVVCKNSYVDRIGVSVCQLIIRDEDQSITTQMFSYKTGSTLVSNDMDQAVDKINTLVELDKTIETCVSKIKEANDLITKVNDTVTEVSTKVVELETKVEDEVLGVDSVLRDVERAESERVDTFNQIKKDNEALKSSVEDAVSNIRDGVTPDITVGDVSTLQPGASVSIVRRGSKENPIFDFGIPQGAPGRDGVDGITPDMTEFEKKINEQYEDIINKNNTFKEKMNTDFGNAKTGYDGKEYLNVVDRLNGDFDNVHQRINDSSYLEYSGSNIKADNSYYGLTKELSIKGRTLQNLLLNVSGIDDGVTENNGGFIIPHTISNFKGVSYYLLGKINTTYTIIINILELFEGNIGHKIEINNGTNGYVNDLKLGINKFTITTNDSMPANPYLRICKISSATGGNFTYDNLIVLEGDYTNTPLEELPFGEGIYSVGESEDNLIKIKSCGKNLFNINSDYISDTNQGLIWTTNKEEKYIEVSGTATSDSYFYPLGSTRKLINFFNPKKGNGYVLSVRIEGNFNLGETTRGLGTFAVMSASGTSIFAKSFSESGYVKNTLSDDIKEFWIRINTGVTVNKLRLYFKFEEGIVNTEYEPYQESTQELQLTEPLRSLPNGVYDEITEDGIEIRRVGKVILDGSFDFYATSTGVENKYRWMMYRDSKVKNVNSYLTSTICSRFGSVSAMDTWNCTKEGISQNNGSNCIYIFLEKYSSILDLSTNKHLLKAELQANPLTVYYELAEPVLINHNKNINLKTFEGTTHITSDNYLLPTITCKVPSNVQATIMNLKEENEFLNNTVSLMSLENEEVKLVNETQDELINTTMLATDEMYIMLEPLLSEVAQTLSLEREVSKMVDLYVAMVMRGLKTIEQVPARYREQVKEILAQLEK